jgi:hypothetical protein
MQPSDRRVLAVAAALVGLAEALAIEARVAVADELVPMADVRIERRALRRLVAAGRVRSVRIGRRMYVSRADLARLLDATPVGAATQPTTTTDAAAAARDAYAAPLRVVRAGGR